MRGSGEEARADIRHIRKGDKKQSRSQEKDMKKTKQGSWEGGGEGGGGVGGGRGGGGGGGVERLECATEEEEGLRGAKHNKIPKVCLVTETWLLYLLIPSTGMPKRIRTKRRRTSSLTRMTSGLENGYNLELVSSQRSKKGGGGGGGTTQQTRGS